MRLPKFAPLAALLAVALMLGGCAERPAVVNNYYGANNHSANGGYGSPGQRAWAGHDIDATFGHGQDSLVRGTPDGNFHMNDHATILQTGLIAHRAQAGTIAYVDRMRSESHDELWGIIPWAILWPLLLFLLALGIIYWLLRRLTSGNGSSSSSTNTSTTTTRNEADYCCKCGYLKNPYCHCTSNGRGSGRSGNMRVNNGSTQTVNVYCCGGKGHGNNENGHAYTERPRNGNSKGTGTNETPYQPDPNRPTKGEKVITDNDQDRRLAAVEEEVGGLRQLVTNSNKRNDERFDAVDRRLNGHQERLDGHDQTFESVDTALRTLAQSGIALRKETTEALTGIREEAREHGELLNQTLNAIQQRRNRR